jgi:tRNA modification GTPase
VGVVRLSGPRALTIAGDVVRGRTRPDAQPSHTLRRVTIIDPASGERLDEALCAVMRGPRSYTGEDVVELSCHGAPVLLRLLVERLVARGARLAQPGEFTRRAFLNGRIDLARAEAVALLIGARTERAAVLAARSLSGELGRALGEVRDRLLDVIAGLEVSLDFPDEAIGMEPAAAADVVAALTQDVARARARACRGRVVHEGVTVAIVGAPNAGKSSLLNALVGRERAIVSPIAGTTRDVIEATLDLGGVPVRLLDTAGLDAPRDAVEAEGIRRSRGAIQQSDLLLVVVDGGRPLPRDVLGETACHPRILVRSKSDLPRDPSTDGLSGAVDVSTVTGDGLDRLLQRLGREVETRADGEGGGLGASLRQMEGLEALERALAGALVTIRTEPIEIPLLDLREALAQASTLLGVDVGDAVLDRIFATFCVGK